MEKIFEQNRIKAEHLVKELRVKHKLQSAKGSVTVKNIFSNGNVEIEENETFFQVGTCLSFLPINEEEILKIGFEKEGRNSATYYQLKVNDKKFMIHNEFKVLEIVDNFGEMIENEVEFIHEVQNIVFATTKKEI